MTQSKVSFSPVLLTSDLFQKAAEMSARAFFTDPMGAYWVPDERKRLGKLTAFFKAWLKCAHGYAITYTVPGTADGTAMWFPPGVTDIPFSRTLLSGQYFAAIGFGWQGFSNYRAFNSVIETVQQEKMPEPHWYLSDLSTDPSRQGQGIGTALMKPVLDRADAAGMPCYLETMTEKNVAFYMKRGFKVAWEGSLPKAGPKVWAMCRDPQR